MAHGSPGNLEPHVNGITWITEEAISLRLREAGTAVGRAGGEGKITSIRQ